MLSQAKIRKVAVAGVTFSVALGIGFVMQNGDALAGRFVEPATVVSAPQIAAITPMPAQMVMVPAALPRHAVLPTPAAEPPAAPVIPVQAQVAPALANASRPAILLIEAPVPAPMQQPEFPTLLAALESEAAPTPPALSAPELVASCQPRLTAEIRPVAMVLLTLAASCAPDRAVTIHHQGMMFSALTDDQGRLQIAVPALVAGAVFIVDLGEGDGAVAVADVPEAATIDRAVLLWQGADGLMIHAREFGAGYGDPGHVWAEAPRDAEAAVARGGGFMIRLGDPAVEGALMAEVYTYPTELGQRSGQVALTVEAEVTDANCGRDIAAQVMQVSPGGPPFAADLTMTLPGCDAVGEFLVLNNMLMDLTLAVQ